jgi:3-hydroxyisobutyrate dehydrogenase
MGGSMAANLARRGFDVKGWNRTPGRQSAQRAAEAGVQLKETPADAVAGAQVVFMCLTDVQDIEQALFGERAVAQAIEKGALVVDMSTTGPACARDLSRKLSAIGLRFLDAPVSGGDVGAREGTLTIMVGGAEADFNQCRPWFEAIGKNIWYCGPSGSGQAVKLCNQILCAVNMVAVCEAFHLAESLDIDPKLVVDVCQTGAAGSWALSNLGPRILRGDLGPGFKIKDMLKDLRLVGEALSDEPEEDILPGTTLATEKFVNARDTDGTSGGDQGTQAMIRAYR